MNIKPKKHRGQHFLTDKNILKKIVEAGAVARGDTVVEIGAGTGNLTELLAQRAGRVVAIEIDKDLIPILKERMSIFRNVEIIHDDARFFDPANVGLVSYSVVANIPYNITSLLIRRLLEADPPPSKMILLVQKEVAVRICARPPEMSILSVAVQYYADARILFSVPRTCFSPRPKVDSAVLSVMPKRTLRNDVDDFFCIVHAGFAHKRKLLASNLASVIPPEEGIQIKNIFNKLSIPSNARAQELSVEQWKALAKALFPFSQD